MSLQLYFNGYVYNLVLNPGPDGKTLIAKANSLGGTLLCTYRGKPAAVINGTLYTQGQNILPGSKGIWQSR